MFERVFVLTGAGVSAESGLATFRGEGGVWKQYRAEEVAHINAWRRDPKLVWEFYSFRRRKHHEVKPNPAHVALAELERRIGDGFFLCTQNVDRLHEMAGSERVAHIHGKIFESKCDTCRRPPFYDESTHDDGAPLPRCECGTGTIRPNVIWFGESLPESELARTFEELDRCDCFVAVGTSGVVEPVASFVRHLKLRRQNDEGRTIPTIYVGPERPANAEYFDDFYLGTASEMVPRLIAERFPS